MKFHFFLEDNLKNLRTYFILVFYGKSKNHMNFFLNPEFVKKIHIFNEISCIFVKIPTFYIKIPLFLIKIPLLLHGILHFLGENIEKLRKNLDFHGKCKNHLKIFEKIMNFW